MRTISSAFGSRISHKIILPYLVLVLFLMLAITFVSVRLTVGALQERLDNRLLEAGQVTSGEIAAIENEHLSQLRALAFTEGVGAAMQSGDPDALQSLVRPHWANAGLSTLIAFDANGQPVLSWQRAPDSTPDPEPLTRPIDDLSAWPIVQDVVREQSDAGGDNFSAIYEGYLYTAAPVREAGGLVGGLLVGLPLDNLLARLAAQSQASATLIYDYEGMVVAHAPSHAGSAFPPSMPVAALQQLRSPEAQQGMSHVASVATFDGRPYQFAFGVLELRDRPAGFFAVALPQQFIADTWANERWPLAALAVVLVVLTVGLGLAVSRQITRPLEELAQAAQSVAGGELSRRGAASSRDEVGVVAGAFNQMTERLVQLYDVSRKLSAHIEIPAIMAEVEDAVGTLVPGATVLAVLDGAGGRTACGGTRAQAVLPRVQAWIAGQSAVPFPLGEQPVMHTGGDDEPSMPAALGSNEVCSLALQVQGSSIGWLVLLLDQPGQCTSAVHAPLVAIASMLASALQKAQLYERVQHESRRRQVILESIADGVLVLDGQRNVVLMNRAAEALFNAGGAARRYTHFDELPLEQLGDGSTRLAASGQIQSRYTCRGRILSASSAPLVNEHGSVDGEVIVLHDVSSEVALSHAKTSLITMVAQELRSPLAGVQGTFELLNRGVGGELAPLHRELTESALRQCRSMSSVVHRVQLLAELEMGEVYAETLPIDVEDVLRGLMVELLPAASAAGVALDLEIADELAYAVSDALLLSMALRQLAEDAIAHSAGLPICISAGSDAQGVWVELRDRGAPFVAGNPLLPAGEASEDWYDASRRGESIGHVITRQIVTRLGAQIEYVEPSDGGHAVRIGMPGVSRPEPELVV